MTEQPGSAKGSRPTVGQACGNSAPLLERPSGLALDVHLIRKTPTTGEDVVLRRAAVTTEIETPERARRRNSPRRGEQHRSPMKTKEAVTTPKQE